MRDLLDTFVGIRIGIRVIEQVAGGDARSRFICASRMTGFIALLPNQVVQVVEFMQSKSRASQGISDPDYRAGDDVADGIKCRSKNAV